MRNQFLAESVRAWIETIPYEEYTFKYDGTTEKPIEAIAEQTAEEES